MKLLSATQLFTRVKLPQSINQTLIQNRQQIRFSGHNRMEIRPSSWQWFKFKDMLYLYTVISAVPCAVAATIFGIRSNGELVDIPEGYEPRHWEYYKHPLSRFIAKHLLAPQEKEYEMMLAFLDSEAESVMLTKMKHQAKSAMKFYNDYRGHIAFRPFFADLYRMGRKDKEEWYENIGLWSASNIYEDAYKNEAIPIEGYTHEGDLEKFDD